eukprot:5071122-Ditylum_brightwellii.AAC.1
MDRPHNATESCKFIGCFNYYQDMWPSRAHIFKPLTGMSDTSEFQSGSCIMQGDSIVTYYSKN